MPSYKDENKDEKIVVKWGCLKILLNHLPLERLQVERENNKLIDSVLTDAEADIFVEQIKEGIRCSD